MMRSGSVIAASFSASPGSVELLCLVQEARVWRLPVPFTAAEIQLDWPHRLGGYELQRIEADHVYFIKLGEGGIWEEECLRDGIIRFGYHETPHELCLQGEWDQVRAVWLEIRGREGTATNDRRQIRTFYEAGPDTIFITFHGGRMFWCRPEGDAQLCSDRSKIRHTEAGWSNTSSGGEALSTDRLSGHLLKTQMFRGTICEVADKDYVLRRLNDEISPEIEAALAAEKAHCNALVDLMRLLTWQDFELLVDLVFSTSGWRRTGELGRTQKTVDLDLVLPTTGERAFVQVKAKAGAGSLDDYAERFAAGSYDRMFFVWHSGDIGVVQVPERVVLVGPERLAKMVLNAGLASWVREKVA